MAELFIRNPNGRYRPAAPDEVHEAHAQYLAAEFRGELLSTPSDTQRFLSSALEGRGYEVFACLFLDSRNRVIGFDEMFYGTINGASVHPREVVRRALQYNAASIIVAHNHPSGVADRAITRRLLEAIALVDMRLLDHIVVGNGEMVSFAERGWI